MKEKIFEIYFNIVKENKWKSTIIEEFIPINVGTDMVNKFIVNSSSVKNVTEATINKQIKITLITQILRVNMRVIIKCINSEYLTWFICVINEFKLNNYSEFCLPSDNTSYASDISLNFLFASSELSMFLSGCHFKANFLYLQILINLT